LGGSTLLRVLCVFHKGTRSFDVSIHLLPAAKPINAKILYQCFSDAAMLLYKKVVFSTQGKLSQKEAFLWHTNTDVLSSVVPLLGGSIQHDRTICFGLIHMRNNGEPLSTNFTNKGVLIVCEPF
jgi:hypothetical protein